MSDDGLYYVVSLKWTRPAHGLITFWEPSNSGYCFRLCEAGKYTAADIARNPGYYNDGEDTCAVEWSKVEALATMAGQTASEHIARARPMTDLVVAYRHLAHLVSEAVPR